ncbi:MAG: hypothetical protein ACOC5T_02355 [Elusimicrobiota bacterium]
MKEYPAEEKNGKIIIKPKIEKDKNGNTKVHVPSVSTISKFKKRQMKNGKRNIQ